MQTKFRYALPIAQMALAAGLLRWSDIWLRAALRVQDMPGPAPAFELLVAINAPVGVVRGLWSSWIGYLPGYWDYGVLILAVGLLWYWIALNLHSWHERRAIIVFRWPPLRIAADLTLVAIGGLLALYFPDCVIREFEIVRRLWYLAVPVLYALWAFVLLFFPGRDLFQCAYLRRHRTNVQAPPVA